jgi:hypothetical protein
MTEQTTVHRDGYATKKGVALFPQDINDVERIRDHYDLDSFSQALRRAIKLAIRVMDEETTVESSAA